MTTEMVRIIAGICAVILLGVIVWRRKSKASE